MSNNNNNNTQDDLNDLFEKLKKAKDAVRWLLDNPNSSVDLHGIAYWAQVVENLRERIAKNL